ncbi:MAG: XRE family transcriptional regulator [Steroidobacteraceae bacterium]
MGKKNIGSDFDSFLKEEGLLEETTAVAVKRYIAYRLIEKMAQAKLSKSDMAKRMETSRSALDRLLDPDNSSVTLQTLQSAVQALGGRLKVELAFDKRAA